MSFRPHRCSAGPTRRSWIFAVACASLVACTPIAAPSHEQPSESHADMQLADADTAAPGSSMPAAEGDERGPSTA